MFLKAIFSAIIYAIKRHLKFTGILNYLYLYNEIFVERSYDTVLPGKNKPSVVFDVGGNIGMYSLYLNEKFDNLKIYIFEPIPELYQFINHNLLSNKKLTNKIAISNFGFSNKKETTKINYFPHASALSTIHSDLEEKENKIKSTLGRGRSIIGILAKTHFVAIPVEVNLIRMSDYITANKIKKIDIVKIDVEGYELEVLQGIDNQHFSKIGSFQIEIEQYRPGNQEKIIALLQKHNYEVSVKWTNGSWSFVVAVRKGQNEPKISQHKQVLKP